LKGLKEKDEVIKNNQNIIKRKDEELSKKDEIIKIKDEELEKFKKENEGLKKQISQSQGYELSLIFISFFKTNNNQFLMLPLVLRTHKIITNPLIVLLLINFS
jgi:hypothetical protein